MTRHKFISKLFHIFMISLMVMQSLVYPWISLLPAPPGVSAQESPPEEATHSAQTLPAQAGPAPSPLDPLLNPDTIFTSTNSAETITPEEVPEATPSATPEPTPETIVTPSSTPSASVAPSSTPTPTPTVSSSPTPTPTTAPVAAPTELPDILPILSPFSISLQYPFAGSYPTSYGFGQRSPNSYISLMQSIFGVDAHDGLDFAMPIGTEILSTSAGTIISEGPGLYGTTIQIEHSWGISYYGHLSDTSVQAGDKVKAGQIIGYSGNSGVTTGPHLHFGIRPVSPNLLNGYHGMIDPAPYLQGIILPKILGTKDGKAIQNRARVRQIKNKFALAQNSLKNDDTNIKVNFASGESSDLNIVLKNPKGFEIDITDQTLGTLTGPLGPSLDVNLTEVVDLVPGLYQLTITDALGNYETQDFSWGVLAINTNKTIYLPSTPVDFSMAVLDNQGDMVCDAQVDLSISSPSGLVTKLSSTTGEVTVNLVTCLSKTYTLNPDYQATFHPTELGNYEVNMSTTTADGTRSISSSFRVSSSVPFDVERVTITRIYPRLDYPVILRVHAFEDFVGTVEDIIPANFELIKPAGDQNPEYAVSSRGDTQVLSWNVVWQKGGDYILSYQFNPPDKSPDFYTFGPLKIGNRFSEIKKWQLAIDVTTTIILNYAHTILTSGTTWTVPADWTDGDNTIEVIGGGGAGRTDTTGIAGAGGGGGGAYAKSVNIALTPGGTVDYQIGQGGIPTSVNGTDTFFNRTAGTAGTCADTTSACAKGGTGATSATGTAGGTAASSFATGTGNVKNNGGTGGTGNTTSDSGGGGGGAGGPNGAGGTGGAGDTDNATDGVGGGGGGNGGGANGGSGITSDTIGAAGGNGNGGTGGGAGGTAADGANGTAGTGGGGGGGSDNMDGGHGANGSDLVAGVAVGSGGGGGGTGDTATTTGMGGNGGLYGAGGGGGRYGGFGAPGVIIITYNGNTPTKNTWVVPADWNSSDNTVTVIGGGGAGVSAAQGTGAAGGGGGGYSKSTNLSLTIGASVDYQVGEGGRKVNSGAAAGAAGTASFFNRTAGTANTCADTVSVCANPGAAGSGTTGGAGGSTTGADGATLFAGGAGGAGNSTGDTSGGGGGAGGTTVGRVGGAGAGTTSGGGGGGGGAGGTSSAVGQAGQATVGGTGGAGPDGTGGGTAGNAGHGGAGTVRKGGGGGGGDDVFGGGAGGSGSSTTYGGGGGGGAGDNNTAATSQAYGGHGGLHGAGGGGGLTNGFGAEGIIIITYTPVEITISGTANGNDGATVKWAKNGTVQASTATIGASAWTITAITPPPSSGDIITVWVDGVSDANETTAVTKYTSGNITGMVLNTNVMTVGSNLDQSLSLTNLNTYDCSEDEDIMHQAASSHLKIEGDACAGSTTNTYTSEKLEILSGDTMTVATAETVTTYDLTITGTLTSSGNSTYNVSHDWANTGTFTSDTSTVNLTGADSSTQTLSGSTSFNNLSASTSSNSTGRTITHTAGTTQTVTGTWTITGFTSKVITLGSSAASAWTINPTTVSVDYASISYSTNSGTAFCATHSTDGGNNIGWSTTSGTVCTVIPAFETSATADTTTTSATDVQMDSMTLTPGAGDYVIQFSTSITGPSASNSTQYVSIYVNNVKIDHSEREVFTEESLNLGSVDAFPTTTQAYVSGVGSSHVIEVRWRTTAPTATAHERVLTARRVDSADMSQATATADTTTTSTSYVQMNSMTLTPGAGDYLVQFSTSIAGPGTTNTTQLASLYVGGTKIVHTERRILTEGSLDVSPYNSFPTSLQAFIPNVGASDVIEVKWNTSSGTATAHERTLTIEKVANSTMMEAIRDYNTTTTSTTDTQLTDMTLTPGAGDYIAMFSSTFEGNTISTTQYASIYVDGSQIARSQREVYTEESIPSTAIPTSTHIYLPGITASQVIEVKWNTTGGTATSYHSTLTLQKVSGNSVDAPTDPTSLTQLTPANATLATGDYHDETSIKFTVSASDPEASDTLYLCVEKDIITNVFAFAEDSCGTGVAYSGSPVTLSVTISNQIDASQYHWHARVKDAAGNYSNWINYGSNTETTRDYGILTGAQVYETHSTTDVTIAAETSDILLKDMTLTPGAGDFVVQFSSSITSSNINPGSTQLVSIFVDGSQVAHTVRRIYTEDSYNTGNAFPVSTQAYIAGVTSGQIVEIRWNTDAGTTTSHERTLTVATVNSANMSQATATADTTTSSTTDIQMDSMTLTPGAGDYLVRFSTSFTGPGSTASSQYASIYVNGVQSAHTLRRADTTSSHNVGLFNSFPITIQAYVSGVTAGQAIEVRWRTTAGTMTGHERTLTLQKVTSTVMAEATGTSATTSTSTTDVQMTGMTLTPGAGDYLIMFSSSLRGDTAQSTQIASIYVGGVRVDQSARSSFTETSFTNDYFGYATHAYVTGVGASDVIEVKWKTSAGTASAYNRTLTVINVLASNSAPDSPSSLAQKTTGDVTIATGNWHNNASVKFTATATDPDSSDTIYLCVEADLLGVSFSNTEDSCGTGVAYSGAGVTITHTLTLTDANEYHWQVRSKDTAGAYSSWVSYGGNAESARDVGIDTTAPTGGTVYDGTGVGVDVSYSDSSLSTLSANWASINSNVSGLVKYEYSIGTTVGGTDIKTWTDNTTSTSVTATGLTLSSSTMYYFNVRTTDGAGNVSTPISSNGQRVAPSISFTIAPAALTFSNLNFANSYTDTQATTLTTSTNAYNGYVIRAFTTDLLRSTDTLTTIADFSAGSYATPATWAGAETGFGYTSSDTTIGGANKFGTATLYAPFSHTGPGDIIADHTNTVSGTPVSNEVFTLTYKVKVPASQAAKPYTATVIYTATAQY